MPFGGLIVNRVAVLDEQEAVAPEAVLTQLRGDLGDALAAKVAACIARSAAARRTQRRGDRAA